MLRRPASNPGVAVTNASLAAVGRQNPFKSPATTLGKRRGESAKVLRQRTGCWHRQTRAPAQPSENLPCFAVLFSTVTSGLRVGEMAASAPWKRAGRAEMPSSPHLGEVEAPRPPLLVETAVPFNLLDRYQQQNNEPATPPPYRSVFLQHIACCASTTVFCGFWEGGDDLLSGVWQPPISSTILYVSRSPINHGKSKPVLYYVSGDGHKTGTHEFCVLRLTLQL